MFLLVVLVITVIVMQLDPRLTEVPVDLRVAREGHDEFRTTYLSWDDCIDAGMRLEAGYYWACQLSLDN